MSSSAPKNEIIDTPQILLKANIRSIREYLKHLKTFFKIWNSTVPKFPSKTPLLHVNFFELYKLFKNFGINFSKYKS